MTKLSHFHFTTNQQATNRILAMGEAAWRVKTVGFPAIDLIQEGNFAKDESPVCSIKPSAALRSVVLPAPLGPTRPTNS